MDLTTISTTTNNNNTTTTTTTTTAAVKTPEAETENPPKIQTSKPFPASNGVLKRTPHHHHHHHHAVVVTYKECLKNHAATLGGHAVDGCGEFMPSPNINPTDPSSLKCAACGCHRNFHRREHDGPPPPTPPSLPALDYQSHHRHHPPPPPPPPPPTGDESPNSASPPPISSSYYPGSAPHMLLALSSGFNSHDNGQAQTALTPMVNPIGRKRFRTKFTQEQKVKMLGFAERVGWKMQKRDDDLVASFCREIGVDRGVLKVWMHNNKNSFGKRDPQLLPNINSDFTANGNGIESSDNNNHFGHFQMEKSSDDSKGQGPAHQLYHSDNSAQGVAANGSNSSSS